MPLLPTRAEKLALLSKIVVGKLSAKEVSDLRKSREPLYITMDLSDGEGTPDEDDPTYHIEIWDNWQQTRCYWKYADGRIEDTK
ncbi:hypothetical protein [Spirosoma spitsbergense]|uniref:hypothetical protein n=1 Tax=Spirosoma spitsbergense TaxID=431554 RepID=UPI00035F2EDF|nr:hypothetical protein [Spirosoma spitsbergense]